MSCRFYTKVADRIGRWLGRALAMMAVMFVIGNAYRISARLTWQPSLPRCQRINEAPTGPSPRPSASLSCSPDVRRVRLAGLSHCAPGAA
jgi:hypothetical protein